jgi:hypothetical protein
MSRLRVSIGLFACLLIVVAFASLAMAQPPTDGESVSSPSTEPPSPNGGDKTAPLPGDGGSSTPSPASSGGTGRSFTDVIPCSACHSTTAWKSKNAEGDDKDVKFDHSTTGFPLTGEHIHAPCAACHNAKRAVKRACISCHEDFHRGRLLQSCDSCHSPAGWRVTQPLEIHRMTRFPLTGMHVLADCTECHVRASEHRWTDAPIECFACHENEYRRPDLRPVHVGTATTAPLPRDCSLCHRAMAWVPATATSMGSTSSPLTGRASLGGRAPLPGHDLKFPIAFGAHRSATCEDCHASLALPRAVRCIGCHAHDPVRLMQQHQRPVATDGASCLTCHPGGARR